MTSLYKKILLLFNHKYRIAIGAVPDNSGTYRYVVSATGPDNVARILFHGDDINSLQFFIPPLVLHTALHSTQVYYTGNTLNNEDVDSWLDRNEERIIPFGFTSDQVINEWDVINDRLYSATITKDAFEIFLQKIPKEKLFVRSLSVPLWDLAILYACYIDEDFVIWKIAANESTLGYVRTGRVYALCNFWPGIQDVQNNHTEIGNEMSKVILSLTSGESVEGVFPVVDSPLPALPSDFIIPNYKVCKAPVIKDLPMHFHEAYACSLHQDTQLDFSPGLECRKARNLEHKRIVCLKYLRGIYIGACALIVLMAAGAGLLYGIKHYVHTRTVPLQVYIKNIDEGNRKLDSLKMLYQTKAFFLTRESGITFLLNEFQTVFPEGMCAEQIEVDETGDNEWHISFLALSYSTALVPQFLSHLEKIRGIQNVRMIYSEQTTNIRERTIRLKIECVWRGL